MKDIDKELIQLLFGDEGIVETDGSGLMDTIRRSQLKQLEKAKALIATQINLARIDENKIFLKFAIDKPSDSLVRIDELAQRANSRIAELRGNK